jgi:UDP-N-acetylmuramoyl-L-alanyl-D-glutamate--2,6-diaminopimelate ligase
MQICPGLGHLESLRKLVPDAHFFGANDIGLSGCAYDWSQVRPGDLFIVWDSAINSDSEVIAKAIASGCAGIVSEHPLPDLNVPTCLVPNAREAFGLICQALAGHPSDQLKIIGVTGANGKTTTSCLIAGILSHAGHKAGLLSTLGYFDGQDVEDATLATPAPDRLAKLLARMLRNGCTHAVMNVSEKALAQSSVAGVRYDAACITNVTRDHISSFFGDHIAPNNFQPASSRLLDHLRGEAFVIVNADDPAASANLREIDGPALTVGINSSAEIMGTPIEQFPSEQTFLITAGSETIPVRTNMIGRHHIYNCLEAAAVGLAYGIELPQIVRSLEAAKHIPGRLERIECGQPFSVFVDFARTPNALAGSLQTLKTVTQGRLICVFGTADDGIVSIWPQLGRTLEQGADTAIITNGNTSGEDPAEIITDLLSGFQRPEHAEIVPVRRKAIHRGLSLAQPGDCVLIAGKGYKSSQNDDEQNNSDDHQIASDWLYEVQPFAKK